jgi:hypothetical protein
MSKTRMKKQTQYLLNFFFVFEIIPNAWASDLLQNYSCRKLKALSGVK